MAQWPNQRISADAGAFHGSEIQSVFGFPEGGGRAGGSGAATAAQKSVSGMMNKAWAAFAKDPEGGLTRLGLPVYDPKGTFCLFEVMALGRGG
jgi:carboxylesterase type B